MIQEDCTNIDTNQSEAKSGKVDPANAKEVRKFTHGEALTNCRLDPGGRFAFAGAEDFGVYRWNLETGEKVIYRGAHDSWVRRIDFSVDGDLLYTSGWDGRVVVWEVEPATIREVLLPGSDDGENAKEPVKGNSERKTESVVDKPVRVIEAHQGFSRWVHAGPNGKFVATCGNDKVIRLWDARRWKLKKEFAGHGRHPYAVMIHPDGESLISEDLMGEIFIWNSRTGERIKELKSGMTGYDNKFQADMGGARDMAFNADGSLVGCAGITNVVNSFAGQQDPIICLVDWKSQEIQSHLRTKSNSPGVAWGVRFHPDGFVVGAMGNQNGKGTIEFWSLTEEIAEDDSDAKKDSAGCEQADAAEVEEKKPRELKPFHVLDVDKAVRGIDFTEDGKRFVVACSDGSLRLYQM